MQSDSFASIPRLQNRSGLTLVIVLATSFLTLSASAENQQPPDVALPVNKVGPSLDDKLANITLSLEFNNASISEAFQYLTIVSKAHDPDQQGVTFIVQPEALKDAKPVTLMLKDVSLGDALRNICRLGHVKFKLDRTAITILSISESADDVNATAQSGNETSVDISHKLKAIVLPEVKLNHLDIAILAQYLAEQSKRYDPDKKGINFVLASISPADKIHREVTIVLENISLSELLPLITQQTNLRCTIENGAVLLKP